MAGVTPALASQAATAGATPPAQTPDLSNLSYSALTGPATFDHAAANPSAPPAAHSMANFIDKLHASGMGALDPNIQISLASMGTANPLVPTVLNTVHKAAFAVKDQVGHLFTDPSLKTQPTTMDQLKWHFANTGIPAVAQQDITKAQQLLIDQGYAPNMKADGTWNANWNTALFNKHQAEFSKPGIGNMSAKDAAMKFLTPGYLPEALPLIKNMIGSTLHSVVHILSQVAQPIVDTATGQEFGLWGNRNEPSLGDKVGAAIESFNRITQHQSPQSAQEYMKTPMGMSDYVNAIGTTLTVMSLVSGAGEAGMALKAGLGKAAETGGGNIAKGLVTSMGADANVPKFTFLNTLFPKTGGLTQFGNAERRLLFSRVAENMPVIGRINGLVNKVADPLATGAGNLWETTRNALAMPYKLPLVAIGGDLATQAMTTGMKLGAIANIEKGVGDTQGPQAQSLDNTKPIAGILGQGIGLLSMGAHAPLYHFDGNASVQVGKSVESMRSKLAEGLNQTDAITAWEQGTHSVFGTEVSKLAQRLSADGDMQAAAHADTLVRQSIANDINIFAASHGAQAIMEDAMKKGQTFNDGTYQKTMQSLESRILNSPELDQWRESLLASSGLARSYWAKATSAMKANSDYLDQNNFTLKLLSDRNMATQVMPHAHELVTPHTLAANAGADFPDAAAALGLNEDAKLASLGRAKLSTQTVSMAQNKALALGKEYQHIEPSFDPESVITKPHLEPGITPPPLKPVKDFVASTASKEEMAIRGEALHYLGNELGLNIKELAFYDTPSLLAQIDKESHRLPGDVVVPFNAHPDLLAAEAYQRGLGYKFVYGTDIGHGFLQPSFDLSKLGIGQSKIARAVTNLGMDFTKVNPSVANSTLNATSTAALQDALRNTERYQPGDLPAWATASNLMQYARSVINPEMNAVLGGQHWAAVKLGKFNKELEAVKAANPGLSANVYKAMVKDAITKASGPADWSLGDFVKALGIPQGQEIKLLSGATIHGAGIEKSVAKNIYDDIQKGLRSAPASVVGAKNPLTLAIQSELGLAGKTVPGISGVRLPNLTGAARNVAIKFRYQGSFAFAMKRIIKTGLKGMTEGVPFTSNPTRTMEELGTTARYQKLWEDIAPQAIKDLHSQADEVEKQFASNDVYNIYKPRDEEAYILGTLYDNATAMSADGNVDVPSLLKTFNKVVSYGDRTAAEKSLNAIFFPFSFEKTVMRQLGGSLLDSSAQRLMVTSALNAYDSLGGQKVKKWLEDNAPLFKEAEKFNPFGHGIGLGQFGGIDRLYFDIGRQTFIQALAPKGIVSAKGAAAVMNLIPAFRDLNNMLIGIDTTGRKPNQLGGELANTLHTSAWELGNKFNEMGNWISGGMTKKAFAPSRQSDPYLPQAHLTYDQQQTDAWNSRSAFLTAYASYLDANERGANYSWPADTPRVGGQKITKTTIGYLINHVFPAWDPAKAMEYVATSKAASAKEREVIQTKSPALLNYYDAFVKNADTVNGYLAKDSYTTAQWAQAVDAMRQSAIYLSYYDRTFYNFYKQYYQTKFGPLEAMR